MHIYQKVLIGYILAINVTSYLAMWFDKYQSKKKGKRVSENTLVMLAFILGALGIYLGLKAPLFHKAAKSKFRFGIPLLVIFNIVITGFIYNSHVFALH